MARWLRWIAIATGVVVAIAVVVAWEAMIVLQLPLPLPLPLSSWVREAIIPIAVTAADWLARVMWLLELCGFAMVAAGLLRLLWWLWWQLPRRQVARLAVQISGNSPGSE
jgi:hypothetical protein